MVRSPVVYDHGFAKHFPVRSINTTTPYLDSATPDFETMSVTSMDPSPRRASQLSSSWRQQSAFPSVTSTPSAMGLDIIPTSALLRYTPELDFLTPLSQSPCLSGTPIPPPPSYLHSRMYPNVDYVHHSTPSPKDSCLKKPFEHVQTIFPELVLLQVRADHQHAPGQKLLIAIAKCLSYSGGSKKVLARGWISSTWAHI